MYTNKMEETFCTDHWRCRFVSKERGATVAYSAVLALLTEIEQSGLETIKTENLYNFEGKAGYSLGLGE